VTGDLDAFPVLVHITDSDLASDARSDGYDIVFTDSEGRSKLHHEIELFNSTSGELVGWVKVPFLSSSTDTVIYMYYGKSGQSSPTENPNEVWDSNFVEVLHLNETGDGTADEFEDSTTYDNHGQGGGGTSGYVPTRSEGKIAGGQEFDGTDDFINVSHDDSIDFVTEDFTVAVWVKADESDLVDGDRIFCKGLSGGAGIRYELCIEIGNDRMIWTIDDDTTKETANYDDLTNWADGTWHYFVMVREKSGNEIRLYDNGVEVATDTDATTTLSSSLDLQIGRRDPSEGTEYIDAVLDEFRISKTVRGTDWINASFNNQNDTVSFLYPGSEENTNSVKDLQSTPIYEWVELYNAGSYAINLSGWNLTDNDGNSFNLSGAGSIPSGGYLICHLNQTGTNSSTNVYGPIINASSSPSTMLEGSDDLALRDDNNIIWDYVAWGADAGSDDYEAAVWRQWTDGEYVDTSQLLENQTLGRDANSNDTDMPADWENETGYADPFGIHRSIENGSSPGGQNIDFIIPEFEEIVIPIIFVIMIVAVWRRKRIKKIVKNNPQNQKKTWDREGTTRTRENNTKIRCRYGR
jgi:hypothetical protein